VGKSTEILYPDLKNPSEFVNEQKLHSESSSDKEDHANVNDDGEGDKSTEILDPLLLNKELNDDKE